MHSGGVTGIHPAREGNLYLSANTPRFWKALCTKVDLIDDERFDTVRKRAQRAAEIVPRLREALLARSAIEWEALFGDECRALRRAGSKTCSTIRRCRPKG
jgi:crotonobetainyl-CoA:carnitine CoA-transferase CaiB-like acyl-CoA transferase